MLSVVVATADGEVLWPKFTQSENNKDGWLHVYTNVGMFLKNMSGKTREKDKDIDHTQQL